MKAPLTVSPSVQMDRPWPVEVRISRSRCGKRNDLLWYNNPALGKNNFLVGRKNISLTSQNGFYLDFSSISHSINDVDISLTNTKDELPAMMSLRSTTVPFQAPSE